MTSRRIARLVRLKRLVEQSRAVELTQREQALQRARDALEATEKEMERQDDAAGKGEPTAQELVLSARYQGLLRRQAQHQRSEVEQQSVHVELGRDDVRDAWRERRLMEGVHERAAEQEHAEQEATERKSHEAIALGIYSRTKAKEG